ncbi:MAG TPA: NAD-dependent epimerase/dehydratase family protein, partial [Candidatus Tumulicola sp.]|nr:NAD-dependent epimerase/dehydratase family protein [Candidatus Tumulicola sp.]
MRVLILGGTAFLGIHVTDALRSGGHEVTHFNRGRKAPLDDVAAVRGDRTVGFHGLEAERFDAVVDTSGYLPADVARSTEFFRERTQRYVFVSSVSVFDSSAERIVESSPMPPLPSGASESDVTAETYGPLKAACERIAVERFGPRATIVRPGLIAGPHDPTDRFTYWPMRLLRGGEVLAPGEPER